MARPPAALAEGLGSGIKPVWDEAYRVTQDALAAERAGWQEPQRTLRAVTNNFNVDVHLDADPADRPEDREALEQALCEVLRGAARRHGLEV